MEGLKRGPDGDRTATGTSGLWATGGHTARAGPVDCPQGCIAAIDAHRARLVGASAGEGAPAGRRREEMPPRCVKRLVGFGSWRERWQPERVRPHDPVASR